MYCIIEVQRFPDGSVAVTPPVVKKDSMEAEGVYHEKLMYAARSSQPKHTVFLLTDSGDYLKSQCYCHEPAPEAE